MEVKIMFLSKNILIKKKKKKKTFDQRKVTEKNQEKNKIHTNKF